MPGTETLNVTCAYCKTTNRVVAGRAGAVCGKCREPLDLRQAAPAAAKPLVLSEASFKAEVLESAQPVLVDFWAPWCGPCRMLAPTIEALAGQLAGKVKVAKLNVDEAQGVAQHFHVMSIPTLIVFKGGRELGRMAGAAGPDRIAAWLRQIGAV